MKYEIKNTAHSKYRREYHMAFALKYRRKEIYGQLKRYWRNIKKIVRTKRSGNNRGRSMPRPHLYACEYTALHKYSTIYGISQREKQFDDIW